MAPWENVTDCCFSRILLPNTKEANEASVVASSSPPEPGKLLQGHTDHQGQPPQEKTSSFLPDLAQGLILRLYRVTTSAAQEGSQIFLNFTFYGL